MQSNGVTFWNAHPGGSRGIVSTYNHPGALESCDGADNDCDGRIDEGCITAAATTKYVYNGFNQLVSSGPELAGMCAPGDMDCDGVADGADNCAQVYNPEQRNSDGQPPDVAEIGGVASYPFDAFVNGYTVDVVGDFAAAVGSATQIVPGRNGKGSAIQTDGTLASAVTTPPALNVALDKAPNGDFTVEGWMRFTEESPSRGSIMGIRDDDSFNSYYRPTAFVVTGQQYKNLAFSSASYSIPEVDIGRWYHLGATYSGEDSRTRLYVNGDEVAMGIGGTSGGFPPMHPLPAPWTFGYAAFAPGGFPAPGSAAQFDDWVFYDKAITGAQMRARATDADAAGDACDACPYDESPTCAPALCTDVDGDGFGVPGASACVGGVGRFDCDDGDASVQPGIVEVAVDGIDNNCDGVVDGLHAAVTGAAVTRYSYDGNGNQVSKVEGGGAGGGAGGVTYEWDARDRLVAVRNGGAVVAEYGYDANNLRVMMREGGVERRVLLDGIEEMAEYDAVGAGARVARYDHDVTRVDALLAQVAGVGAGVSKVHLWTDALGSVYGLRDSSGNLQAQYSYDVYGARTGGGETPWGFTGRTADGTTGLQYSRQRYLDSSTGRWTQKDSDSQYTDGFNRYFYVKENPVGRIDPSGTVSAFLTTGGSGEDACEGLSEPSLHPGIATANRDIIITEASGAEVVIRGDILLKDGTVSTNWEAKFTFNDDKFSTIAAFKCKCDSPSQKCAEFRDGLSDRFEENGKAFGLGVATLNFPKVKECNLGKSFAENVASTIFHEWVHFSVFNQTPTKGRVKMSWEGAPSGGYRSIDEWVARAMENRVYGSSTARDYD